MKYHQIIIDDYIFTWNHLQGIINIENENEEFVSCIELGAWTKLNELEFRYKCKEWLEREMEDSLE